MKIKKKFFNNVLLVDHSEQKIIYFLVLEGIGRHWKIFLFFQLLEVAGKYWKLLENRYKKNCYDETLCYMIKNIFQVHHLQQLILTAGSITITIKKIFKYWKLLEIYIKEIFYYLVIFPGAAGAGKYFPGAPPNRSC